MQLCYFYLSFLTTPILLVDDLHHTPQYSSIKSPLFKQQNQMGAQKARLNATLKNNLLSHLHFLLLHAHTEPHSCSMLQRTDCTQPILSLLRLDRENRVDLNLCLQGKALTCVSPGEIPGAADIHIGARQSIWPAGIIVKCSVAELAFCREMEGKVMVLLSINTARRKRLKSRR